VCELSHAENEWVMKKPKKVEPCGVHEWKPAGEAMCLCVKCGSSATVWRLHGKGTKEFVVVQFAGRVLALEELIR